GWERTQHCGRGRFDVTIQKCLWHTACSKHGCPWLCRLFCDADNIIGFTFTKKLSTGGDCCGFHFFKKQSAENR
ncbi:MAG: L-2-amino-thiazoline-4-carboxylic acid hydrolase, partial [Gemmiger qucibialis]